jgi:hypothetical protein
LHSWAQINKRLFNTIFRYFGDKHLQVKACKICRVDIFCEIPTYTEKIF